MRSNRKLLILVIASCTLLLISPIKVQEYQFPQNTWTSITLNSNHQIILPILESDLNGDGSLENLIQNGDQIRIETNGSIAWQSPQDWQVKQALISDINWDGELEVILLVRRPYQPWPVDRWLPYGGRISSFQDTSGYSCHIILIGWTQGEYKEVWAGSGMSQPALEIGAADVNQDGRIELVTLEGSYTDTSYSKGNAIKLWSWNGFGFSLLHEIPGNFSYFQIIQSINTNKKTLIGN